jgi:5-methylcytosine-specific restriction endonuclease McrA
LADTFGEPQARQDRNDRVHVVCAFCAASVDVCGWLFVEEKQWRGATWRDPTRYGERQAAGEAERRRALREIAARDGWKCVWCSLPLTAEVDHCARARATKEHLIPRSQGGLNKATNITLACNSCNSTRGTLDLSEQYLLCLADGRKPRVDVLQAAAARLQLPQLLTAIKMAAPAL